MIGNTLFRTLALRSVPAASASASSITTSAIGRRNFVLKPSSSLSSSSEESVRSLHPRQRQHHQQQRQRGRRSVHIERRLEELGIILPPPPGPKANYNIVCRAPGDVLYVSGHLPIAPDGSLRTGAVGPDTGGRTIEEGYEAARHCGLNIISTLSNQLDGNLDRVEQIIKVFGIVNSHTEFKSQHLVMDGCSDVLMEVFGNPVGYHARSAIGTSTLPLDMIVEVEAIVKVKP